MDSSDKELEIKSEAASPPQGYTLPPPTEAYPQQGYRLPPHTEAYPPQGYTPPPPARPPPTDGTPYTVAINVSTQNDLYSL